MIWILKHEQETQAYLMLHDGRRDLMWTTIEGCHERAVRNSPEFCSQESPESDLLLAKVMNMRQASMPAKPLTCPSRVIPFSALSRINPKLQFNFTSQPH